MKAAIFGGSFDPPHKGHEEIIKKVLQNLDIDVLFVVPTYLNPFKKKYFAPPKVRYKWVKKLLLPYKKAKVIDYELRRHRPVATIETVRYLKNKYKLDKIYLIIGADNLTSLHKWKHYDRLRKTAEFVVATRGEVEIPKKMKKLDISVDISSTTLRKKPVKAYLPKRIANDIMRYYRQHQHHNKEQNES